MEMTLISKTLTEMLYGRTVLFFEMEGKRPANCKKLQFSELQVEILISCLHTSFSQLAENLSHFAVLITVAQWRTPVYMYM